jgi:hypothetical protein
MPDVVAALHGQLASIFGAALDAWLMDFATPGRLKCSRVTESLISANAL